jgi:2-polyprenyl-6-methoxyphenol hydroxylase-like FAD-dependent oxidoreductase
MTTTHQIPNSDSPGHTTCAIVGGGPAGLVLGLLLARAGVQVTVLEKHADFLRDFRGDTVHPTTLALLDALGLFERFDALPQSQLTHLQLPNARGKDVVLVDFRRLSVRHPYIAMVPQWDLLNLLAEAASKEPNFTLLTEHEVTGIVCDNERVAGVEYRSPSGQGRLLADLTVACDGRGSTVRGATSLPVQELPVKFDVWWYRINTSQDVGTALLPRIINDRLAIVIPRVGYVQVAQLGPKGTDAEVRARGIEAFRAQAAELLPAVADDVSSIATMEDVKHLDVRVDRLRRWYAPGVLCIGDAAHAMSPVGGIGINLAVQDAVAAARLLATPLLRGDFRHAGAERFLARVQRRRMMPTILLQGLQRLAHALVIMPALRGRRSLRVPKRLSWLLEHAPFLSVIPAFAVGVGPRPEKAPQWAHRTPADKQPPRAVKSVERG